MTMYRCIKDFIKNEIINEEGKFIDNVSLADIVGNASCITRGERVDDGCFSLLVPKKEYYDCDDLLLPDSWESGDWYLIDFARWFEKGLSFMFTDSDLEQLYNWGKIDDHEIEAIKTPDMEYESIILEIGDHSSKNRRYYEIYIPDCFLWTWDKEESNK